MGNVIPPSAVTHGVKSLPGEPRGFDPNGVDVMRLWLASHDFTHDVSVSRVTVDNVAQHYKRMRNTVRWVLGTLADYDPALHASAASSSYLARHLLGSVADARRDVMREYHELSFAGVVQRMSLFTAAFSSLHVEAMKDSLYCDATDEPLRRSYQHALLETFKLFLCAFQPLTPHTVVDMLRHSPPALGLTQLVQLPWNAMSAPDAEVPADWPLLAPLRDATNRLLEDARNAKLLGSPLEGRVMLQVAQPQGAAHRALTALDVRELVAVFGTVSRVDVGTASVAGLPHHARVELPGGEAVHVGVAPMEAQCKCPRCRVRGPFDAHPQLMCPRCARIVEQ